MRFYLFFPILMLLVGCYEPKSGCLDLDATNYDASADDLCPNCCTYPKLSLQVQHFVSLPSLPDSLFSLKYDSAYHSFFDTNEIFFVHRSRFFISDFKLVEVTGEEVGVLDSVWLPTKTGDSIFVENNFSKHDRDIFQAASLGTVKTAGSFSGVKFTLGVPQIVLDQVQIDTVKTGNALAVKNDTLSYDSLTGIIPNHLIISRLVLGDTVAIDFRFEEPKQISLSFSQPVSIERGFNVKLVIGLNYSVLFQTVDFKNDTPEVMQAKIDSQLTNAFYVVSIKLE